MQAPKMQSPAHRLLTPRRRTNCNGLVLRHCRPSPFSHLSVFSFFPLLFSLSGYLTRFELTSINFCSVGRVMPHVYFPLFSILLSSKEKGERENGNFQGWMKGLAMREQKRR